MLFYIAAAILVLISHTLYRHLRDPLNKYPGPWLATWTDLWRLQYVALNFSIPPLLDMHARYGPIVRLGPSNLSFASPHAIRDIYGTDKPFRKSDYYFVAAAVAKGRPNPSLFSSLDAEWHDRLRRTVNASFSLSALREYEPYVANTVRTFVEQLDARFADKTAVLDLATWMHWYAFDVIGELTYGAQIGFLRTASDVDGIIAKTDRFLIYAAIVGQMPWLDRLLLKNPVWLWLNRNGWFNSKPNPVVAFALKRQTDRQAGKREAIEDGRVDLMDKFLAAKDKHPDVVGDKEVLGMGLSMVLAGSESTAISLTATFYYLLKNPATYKKLLVELDTIDVAADTVVPFSVAHNLPYLDACIKEAFRIHPAARFSAERVLPSSGALIAGQHIPGGTVVGANAWVLHRDPAVFGEDVDSFVPERWISDVPEKQKQIAEMNRTLFQFGAGKFGCIGKNISLLEMYKVVPTLLRNFDFALKDQDAEWRLTEGTFSNVTGVDVLVKRRTIQKEP